MRKRILAVEDNDINLEILIEILESLGCQATGAEHGKQALEILEDEEPFDAVLMDIHMPVMDGFETTKAIREMTGDLCQIPIIALTGESLIEERSYAAKIGMNGFITKPVTAEQMKEVLEGIV